MFAGIAWVLAAATTGYLAYLQWEVGSALQGTGLDDGGLTSTAAWNAVSAVLTAYFGARCILGTSRGMLTTSTAWAVLGVGWGAIQLIDGVGSWIFALVVVLTAAAGVLSWVARSATPQEPREPWVPERDRWRQE